MSKLILVLVLGAVGVFAQSDSDYNPPKLKHKIVSVNVDSSIKADGVRILPDPILTPGIFGTPTHDQMCRPGYSTTIRKIGTAERKQVFADYGIPYEQHSHFELDHLVSLEINAIGKDNPNDGKNLWPQPYENDNNTVWGAHTKDRLENELRKEVCAGTITLEQAQHGIATDWISLYKSTFHTDVPLSSGKK